MQNTKDKQATDDRTGFPLTDEAIKALGPEIYDQAKRDLDFPDGPYTSVMDAAIANRMSTLVDRATKAPVIAKAGLQEYAF